MLRRREPMMTPAARTWMLRVALAIAALVLVVPLAIPLFSGRIFSLDDFRWFHAPMRALYQKALRAGWSLLWTSDVGSGVYIHGEGQSGRFHPLHLALYSLFPVDVALNLELLCTVAIAAGGMWLWLRRVGMPAEVAAAGGLAFGFCGFNVTHAMHMNMVAAVAHMPLVLWASDLVLTGGTRRERATGQAGVALAIGSQFLLGFPQSVYWTLIAVFWYALYQLAVARAFSRVVPLLAAVALGGAIGAAQILPTLDFVQGSLRVSTTENFRLSFSLHPLNLVQLFSPYTFAQRVYVPDPNERFIHEFSIYNGALSTLAVFWIVARWNALRHKALAAALLALAAAGLLLAFGRYGGIYPLLSQLPGLSGFRAPGRHVVLMHLAMAGLVALTLEDLFHLSQERRPLDWRTILAVAVPVAVSGLLVAGVLALAGTDTATAYNLGDRSAAMGFVLMAVVAVPMLLAARGLWWAVPLLIVTAAVDLTLWGPRYLWSKPPIAFSSLAPSVGLPPGASPGDLVMPEPNQTMDFNVYPMWRLRSRLPYLGLIPRATPYQDGQRSLRLAGVHWQFTWAGGWKRIGRTMPRARLVPEWRVSAQPAVDLSAIDIGRVALVGDTPGGAPGKSGVATLVQDRPGRLVVDVEAPSEQMLAVTERFHAGWTADIDGQVVTARALYGDFLGVVVPAGTHRVTFTFDPPSARWGLRISAMGVLATLAAALWIARGSKRRARTTRP